ncbi:TAF5-like RNA polymerase II p300/CBP-associated factor-associated factor 65 kDa subunit 5L isoform X2 [Lycorma delicatula]|uniref:TAF5-like RNA polymerase II p300/CBP-associated factor-associated factor 65 kDa subunit 5L isoform X2 n=1 Tax=Lycorma delicatula TaxID=130591 RepID=UPI003F512A39
MKMSKTMRNTKRSGRDIKATVGSYLRRRHYIDSTDSFRMSELVTKQSSLEMAVDAAIQKDVSCLNLVLYSSPNSDIQQVEQQLIKLWSWITEIEDTSCKLEMSVMLLPLFSHLYLDMLRRGQHLKISPTITEEFLNYHSNEEASQLVSLLAKITSPYDVDNVPILKAFRSSKFHVKLSSKSMAMLKKYLETNRYIVLLEVLQKWFELEVLVDSSSLQEDEGALNSYSEDYEKMVTSSRKQSGGEEKELRQLHEAIRVIRETPAIPSPILTYTINNTEKVCCASVSRTFKLLATGTLNSELRLWNLQETKLPPCLVSNVPLGCDTQPIIYQQQESRYCILRGHCGPVYDTAFLTEADVVLSVSHDTDMRAWKLGDYSCAAVYKGHTYPVWCVDVGLLGLHIATGSQDRTVRVWNLDRTYPLRIMSAHTQDINCVKFHPNGCYMASSSQDKTVRMWHVSDGRVVRLFVGHTGSVQALAFSPNGSLLASGGDGGRVKIWDIAGGKLLADLKGHTSRVVALDWSKDGSTVASAASDGSVLLWKAHNVNPDLSDDSSRCYMKLKNVQCYTAKSGQHN